MNTPQTRKPSTAPLDTRPSTLDPRHSPNWLALAGAGGASLVAAGSADAATVQIDLIGNQIGSGGWSLYADLTGDSNADVVIGGAVQGGIHVNGYIQSALVTTFVGPNLYLRLGSPAGVLVYSFTSGPTASPLSGVGLLGVTFTDSTINGGVATSGFLEVQGFNTLSGFWSIALTRLVFDNASATAPTGVVAGGSNTSIGSLENGVFTSSAIPEPSRLALLALGAGGILARRQRKKKAAA